MIPAPPVHEGPKINWDAPLGDAKFTSPSAATKDGAITFARRTPRFSIIPIKVQVTSPASTAPTDRAVAYVYKFPTRSAFPTDSRIRVLEYIASSTKANPEEVATNPPGPPENFAVVTIAGHRTLLVQADEIGRIQFIQDDIMFDITGPRLRRSLSLKGRSSALETTVRLLAGSASCNKTQAAGIQRRA